MRIIRSASLKRILDQGAVYERDGRETELKGVDAVVLARGGMPSDALSAQLSQDLPTVHVIGDARDSRTALEAIAEGAQVARAI